MSGDIYGYALWGAQGLHLRRRNCDGVEGGSGVHFQFADAETLFQLAQPANGLDMGQIEIRRSGFAKVVGRQGQRQATTLECGRAVENKAGVSGGDGGPASKQDGE